MELLKPSAKSIEGWNIIIYAIAGMGILYTLITGNEVPSTDELLKGAQNVQDIIAAYKGVHATMPDAIQNLGISGGVLAFLYKAFSDFLKARSSLKEKEMELKLQAAVEEAKIARTDRQADMHTATGNAAKKAILSVFALFMVCAFHTSAFAFDAEFSWLPNTESDLAGYKVHWGTTESKQYEHEYDCGIPTTSDDGRVHCTVADVPVTLTYFAATAYDSAGAESDYSNEISVNFKPSAPSSFSVEFPVGAVIKVTPTN
jgi:hypothetical protein